MFEKIELFTKRDNIVELPNENWTTKTKIHCTCELNLGFGDKVIWTYGNSIKLTKMIEFYNKLAYFSWFPSEIETSFIYEFVHNDWRYIFDCIKNRDNISYVLKRRYYNSERALLQKKQLNEHSLRRGFFIEVMKILTSSTNNEVCTKIGELFFRINGYPHNYELKIGQKVRTVVGQNIKTERIGYIINRFHHDKEGTNMYLIMENDKLITTRYRPNEIEIFN